MAEPVGETWTPLTDVTARDEAVADNAASTGQGSKESEKEPEREPEKVPEKEDEDKAHKAYSHPTGEYHRLGLEVVAGDENLDASYDIVAIHGMHSWSRMAWKKRPEGPKFQSWLDTEFKDLSGRSGRVILYGYDPGNRSGETWTSYGVYKEAEALLDALLEVRTPKVREKRRPIWFLSHDIGGLVIKAAMILATRRESKYADILHCTRSLVFFGYPHRYRTRGFLEEGVSRFLLCMQYRPYIGSLLRAVKSLSQLIIEVNDDFIHTPLLTQANLINVISSDQDFIFDIFTTTLGVPFGRQCVLDLPNHQLVAQVPNTAHPFCELPNMDWLVGELPDHLHPVLRRFLNQASPVYPYMRDEDVEGFPEIEGLSKSDADCVIHLRCSHSSPATTAWVSERARIYLHGEIELSHPLLYFKFDTHDIRFNNAKAMLQTFVARLMFSRLKDSEEWIQNIVEEFHTRGVTTLDNLFYGFEYLRSQSTALERSTYVLGCFDECDDSALWILSQLRGYIERNESGIRMLIITTRGTDNDKRLDSALSQFPSGIVTSVEYEPPKPQPFDVNCETSLVVQERPQLAWDGHYHDIRDLLSKCEYDENLCQLLIDWLKTAQAPFERSAKPLQAPVSPEWAFPLVLSAIPNDRRIWAQKLLTWMITSLRPLRVIEFCRISDDLWLRGRKHHEPPRHERDSWYYISDILKHFGGLLVVVQGEIRFRHPDTRGWLLNQHNAEDMAAWYRTGLDVERHAVVLETCVDYLRDKEENDASVWAEQLPYAIEFLIHHYQQAITSQGMTEDLLEDETLFQRWIDAYAALPSPFLKPLPSSRTLLPLAAHFGLEGIVQRLLAKPQEEARNQALVEAARAGQLSVLEHIVESYSPGFEFDDDHLHEAVKLGAYCGNPAVFRKLVEYIPKPPYPIPERKPSKEPTEDNLDSRDSQSSGEVAESSRDDRNKNQDRRKDDEDQGSSTGVTKPKIPHDPFHWLAEPLLQASSLGLDDAIIKLLSIGANPNPPKDTHPNSTTPLHRTAYRSHISSIKLLLEAGADVNRRNSRGFTPLCLAESGLVVATLLENGAAIDAKTNDDFMPAQLYTEWGNYHAFEATLDFKHCRELLESLEPTPLICAAEFCRLKCLKLLLRHGFNPNIASSDGRTALWWTVVNRRADMCRLLLEKGADPELTPEGATTPLIRSVFSDGMDILKLLIKHGANVDKMEWPRKGVSFTPLHAAIDNRRIAQIEYLLKHGANPNVKDSSDVWAIHLAAENGLTDVVRMLADAGADLNPLSDINKWTPAHAAYRFPKTLELLIERGADMTIQTVHHYTPLDLAIFHGELATIEVLLKKAMTKFDFSLPGTQLSLVHAVEMGYVDVIDTVLEAGADVNTKDPLNENNKNESLLSIAMRLPDETMVRKLLEFRPDLEQKSEKGNTALHSMTSDSPVACFRLVVHAGGRLDAPNMYGKTPLHIAANLGNKEVFKYMMTKEAARANLHVPPPDHHTTMLHDVCRQGSLELVQLLIDHHCDVNFACEGQFGTPLTSAVLGLQEEPDGETKEVMELLLKEGADPSISAGLFGYPINAASMNGSAEIVQLLLDNKASIDVKSPLGQNPGHMACYNSLEILNLLKVPDSDFSVRDAVGRVPLHYAVMSGQLDLIKEVLARSERVGVGIDVKDDDGWTPLLWAARATPTWNRQHDIDLTTVDVVSFLLEKGADPTTEGEGFSGPSTASRIAYYSGADAIGDFIVAKLGKEPPSTKRRGKEMRSWSCDCCLLEIIGTYSVCEDCPNFSLCFKCSGSRSKFHPRHSFVEKGEEWDDDGKGAEKAEEAEETAKNADGNANPNAIKPLREGNLGDEFDDEIVG